MAELGYDVPAVVGMAEADIQTPCLMVDLAVLEANLDVMANFAAQTGLALRPHGKMHKCAAVAQMQVARGAVGMCCQKVSEAEAFVRAGVTDVLVTNEVRDPVKLARLAALARTARVAVCVDDPANVPALSAAARGAGVEIGVLVEFDCGQGRCGVTSPAALVEVAAAVQAAPGLRYDGVQAYQGAMQHVGEGAARERLGRAAQAVLRRGLAALTLAGLPPSKVSGGGTGSFRQDAASGLWTELQCGSYAFMDADYGRISGQQGRLDAEFAPALFVLTSIISRRPGKAVGDAGLKSMSGESELPTCAGFQVLGLSDEHVEIADPDGALQINQRLRLVPGHCDPTVYLHDLIVAVRGGVVEALWPVTARGRSL